MSRILIVDDVADIAQMYALKLHNAGHKVLAVCSGHEAIARYREAQQAGTPFEMVLMDLAMPHMNGFDAADTIRELNPDALIVFLTAFDEPMSVGRATRVDAIVLAKPCEDIESKVAELLSGQGG